MAEITKNTEKSTESTVVDAEQKEEFKEEEYIPTIEEGQFDPTCDDGLELTNSQRSSTTSWSLDELSILWSLDSRLG